MSEPRFRLSRRLSVVWFTVMVDYSRLSARDHDGALALGQRFQELVWRTVPSVGDRVIKFLGDAALLESPSAEAALAAARALHGELGEGLRTQAFAQLGRLDEAFAHLDPVVDARHPIAPSLVFDPALEPLRGGLRCEGLKRRLGLPA